MNILQRIREDQTVKAYWESLLGEEQLSMILSGSEYGAFLEQEVPLNQTELQDFLKPFPQTEETEKREEWVFYPFYCRICHYIRRKLSKVFQQRHLIFARQNISRNPARLLVEKNVPDNLAWQYTGKIREIPLRCLLQEMEELKQSQKLLGENEKQQYEYFQKNYLSRKEFLMELAEKYPVMQELIFQKAEAFASGLAEMLSCFEQEKEGIKGQLCRGEKIRHIQNIETGLSDEHSPGKTVASLEFDNGTTVYYKPRSLRAELEYQRMYHHVCRQCGLENYDRGILDCGTHGWEGGVRPKACKTREQLWRYYERMGIHLCLSYLFGISDIHFENVIACGEYPVLIDLEVFPGYRACFAQKDPALAELKRDSVLGTGMLPGQAWGNAAVNVSAMASAEVQKSPFKIPVIREKNTSNMHISYEQAELESAGSVPELDGQKAEAADFLDAVEKGFGQAYEYIFQCREAWMEQISAMQFPKSRYVMRHTQQYKMYQMTATFPEFMKESAAGKLMLLRMERGLTCAKDRRKELLFYEIETVMQGCFPVYYVRGNSLETGRGESIPDYFATTVQEQVIERLKRMGSKDKRRQQKFIALSMWAEGRYHVNSPKAENNCNREDRPNAEGDCNREERPNVENDCDQKDRLTAENDRNPGNGRDLENTRLTAHQIAEQIREDTEELQGEVQWIRLKSGKDGSWQFQATGRYLYDGIAGSAIFLMAYRRMYGMEKYSGLCENIIQQMFAYTDHGVEDPKQLESRHTGIMNGESSIVYTYLVLHCISEDRRFLDYAKKHAKILEELLKEDRQYDILDGNAGAVIALLHLYRATGNRVYLEQAKQAAELLLTRAVPMEKGIGWQLPGQSRPLAGFAHGNSGIMLAFARLWEATGIARYCAEIEEIRRYEDSLYDENMGNWQDIRGIQKGRGRDVTAWCHGAAGILTAALQTDRIMGIDPEDDWRCRQAERKVRSAGKRECCLCHGRMGNAAALRYKNRAAEKKEDFPEHLAVTEWKELSPGEKYQAGFMTGLSGIGYELLKREEAWLPEILALEL